MSSIPHCSAGSVSHILRAIVFLNSIYIYKGSQRAQEQGRVIELFEFEILIYFVCLNLKFWFEFEIWIWRKFETIFFVLYEWFEIILGITAINKNILSQEKKYCCRATSKFFNLQVKLCDVSLQKIQKRCLAWWRNGRPSSIKGSFQTY